MPSKWIGASTKGKLVQDRVRGKRTIGSIARTSYVIPVSKNAVYRHIQDSEWNQLKEDRPSSVQQISIPRMST